MAGAGYKLFNTGDVLTAAQVNQYLQEQTVMVFASAAARTTALTGVVAEGMISYLTDTDVVQYYNGTTWTTINTDQTPLTTKGDLFTFSTQDARLAVGNNGETLVADSSATTGLRWQADWNTGKNKIINGDFYWNQRNFTSNTTNGSYNFDRWFQQNVGTYTVTPQTFTLGSAPVAGYEGRNFVQAISSGHSAAGDVGVITQRIEDVRTLANQTVTVSFWAKADTGTPKIGVELVQNFGSGGSPTAQVSTPLGAVTLSTNWARYSVTVALPSIAGKTLGTTANTSYLELNLWTSAGSTFATRASSIGIQNFTASIWGVQVEAASVATPFTTATGTLAGELAACYRYYYRQSGTGNNTPFALGFASSTTNVRTLLPFPSAMRVAPTSVDFSTLGTYDGGTQTTITAISLLDSSTTQAQVYATVASGLTTNRPYFIQAKDSSAAYLALNAEL